jgi:hypothetical protein
MVLTSTSAAKFTPCIICELVGRGSRRGGARPHQREREHHEQTSAPQGRTSRLAHSRDASKEPAPVPRFELRALRDPIRLRFAVNELENFERARLEDVELFEAVGFVKLKAERFAREL